MSFIASHIGTIILIALFVVAIAYSTDPWLINRRLRALERRIDAFPSELMVEDGCNIENAVAVARSNLEESRRAQKEGREYSPWFHMHRANHILDAALEQQAKRNSHQTR